MLRLLTVLKFHHKNICIVLTKSLSGLSFANILKLSFKKHSPTFNFTNSLPNLSVTIM